MKKTFITTAVACVLMFFGFASFAQTQAVSLVSEGDGAKFSSNKSNTLKLLAVSPASSELDLVSALSQRAPDNKVLGFKRSSGEFVSLSDAIADVQTVPAESSAKVSVIPLGSFSKDETFQLGYADENGENFESLTVKHFTAAADASYYASYNADSFYQLDFSEDPFDGMIEVVIGEPLPAPAVTLIVALAAGALFLLYKNRRQRSIQIEQA